MTAHRIEARLVRGDFTLDVSLAWDERVAVLFGPSGAGKSTLLELLLGLHPAARPRVRIGGVDLDDPVSGRTTAIEARALGWVPQEALLFPHLRVEQNLRFGGRRLDGRPAGNGGRSSLRVAHCAVPVRCHAADRAFLLRRLDQAR